ncbi:MAG: hypothetical protein U9O56_00370 [Campylobacterota bacterium]|nr:hypothetical protein [Campylobacterota bacterium]
MKKIILATTIAASTLLAVPNDGIVIGLGLGNTSTTSTVKTEGYLNSTSSEDESGNWTYGYRYQSLSTDLEGADTLFEDTRYETKFDVSHKDFTTSMFFVNYHF